MRLPVIRQKVAVRVLHGPFQGLYSTYVEGIDEKAITVAQPMNHGAVVPLAVGDKVEVEFVDGGDRLVFEARVLGHFTQVVPIVALSRPAPGAVKGNQQRDFVRLEASLPVALAVINEQNPAEEKVYSTGRTADISGNGAQIITAEEHPLGTKLELTVRLPTGQIALEATVVRLVEHHTPRMFRIGVQFTQVEERDRERIVRYIFAEQRQRRQKGLL